jgi:alpha-tubulin suppressor-like RCC1 family protein
MPHPFLESLLHSWRQQLSLWSQSGALSRAAEQALLLGGTPERLRVLVGRWSAGNFEDLPPVVVLPASAMPTAAGAYALSTGTIYLNRDWLQQASREQVLAVLTEELGHHLDGVLNSVDSPGDEGEMFAALVRGDCLSDALLSELKAEKDTGLLEIFGQQVFAEFRSLMPVSVSVSEGTVQEDTISTLIFTFTRHTIFADDDYGDFLIVFYAIGGSASLDVDYTSNSMALVGDWPEVRSRFPVGTIGIITFDNLSYTQNVIIRPLADIEVETNEDITLTILNAWGLPGADYYITSPTFATSIILNDDFPVITLAVSPASVTEDSTSNLVYTFSRTGATTSALTVNYTIAGTATLGTDYTGIPTTPVIKTVTFAAGAITTTVTVDPIADNYIEPDETVALTLATGTGYTIGTISAVSGTILNDDSLITLAVSPASVTEDSTSNLVYTFSRTGATTSALTVNYTIAGTATLGTDYTGIAVTSATKSITFATGSATATLTVDPTADTTIEPNETVEVTLATGTGYAIGTTGSVVGTISNDDFPSITLAVSPSSVTEDGAANLIYIFSRSGDTSAALTVNYTVAGSAILGSDYTGVATTPSIRFITFTAGLATATLTIDPSADTTIEPNETVEFTLATGTGYTMGTTGAVISTISNDDLSIVQIAFSSMASISEDGPQNIQVVFSRSGDVSEGLTVNFVVGGTATVGSDYDQRGATSFNNSSGSVSFAAGSSVAILSLDPRSDAINDGTESLVLTLTPGSGYLLGSSSTVTGTILDNNLEPGSVISAPISRGYSSDRALGESLNAGAFAVLTVNGSVVTWGDPSYGGDSSSVADQLSSGIIQIFSINNSFAALKSDGSVVTWGSSAGDSSSVSGKLSSGVTQIFSNNVAFAALKADGSVVTWGENWANGNSREVAGQLTSGVTQVFSNGGAFAALKADGSVVTWGREGGDNSAVVSQLRSGVTQIFSTWGAFAALKSDGSVVTWGRSDIGGNSSGVGEQLLSGVTQIFSTESAFAALKADGSVITWGNNLAGGNSIGMAPQLNSGVTHIFSNRYAFAALKNDGSVVTWGDIAGGGSSSGLSIQLGSGVTQIFSTWDAFAALKSDGSVITWGNKWAGGDSSSVAGLLSSGVTKIFSNFYAFAALKADGSVITWGDTRYGGTSSGVADQLSSGITEIFSTGYAFAVLKSDGSVVTWGDPEFGGDSSSVARELRNVVAFANPFTDDRLVLGPPPSITLVVVPASVTEDGTANLIYIFRRTGPTTSALTVNYTVAGTATLGSDYTGISPLHPIKTVTFAPGAAFTRVTVNPTADAEIEADETVALTLAPGSDYTLGTTTAVVGTIRNDDPKITLAVAPASVTEDGPANLIYTFSRTGAPTEALTVKYTVGGTARLGLDYTGINSTGSTKTVTFAAGAATATVEVDPTPDTAIEWEETVDLTLIAGTGYTLGATTWASGTIQSDDISSSVTTTLGASGSSLLLTGNAAINGTGNSLNNTLTGNTKNNRLTGLLGADVLTGGGTTDSDVFAYTSLNESLLGTGNAFDQITDFNSKDRLSAPPTVAKQRLTSAVGNAGSLTEASISAILTRTTFAANSVAAFTTTGQAGIFIAMNDGRSGYQANSDATIFLQNYAISSTNAVAFI